MRTYGKVTLDKDAYGDPTWVIQTEPQVALRLKRTFTQIFKGDYKAIYLSANKDNTREIEWFLLRYPMEMTDGDRLFLTERAEEQRQTEDEIAAIMAADYEAPDIEMALPPREYQKVAAHLAMKTGRLLVADDLGLGKTITALCALTDPSNLPALVVTLTHLPKQWENEVHKFLPALRTHIVKKSVPYDMTKITVGRGKKKKEEKVLFPDVIIINYHKLRGWSETLAGVTKSVIFDECLHQDTDVWLWPTSRGTTKIKDIRHGETISAFTDNGHIVPDEVSAVVCKGQREVWKVTLCDGRFIVCTNNEKLLTTNGWVYLQEIIDAAGTKNTSKQDDSDVGRCSPDGSRYSSWGRLYVMAERTKASKDTHAARLRSGSILPSQSGCTGELRSNSAQDGAEPRMGEGELCVQYSDIASVRASGTNLLQNAQARREDESSYKGVVQGSGLACDSLLVHGRRVGAEEVGSRSIFDAFVFGEGDHPATCKAHGDGDRLRGGSGEERAERILDNKTSERAKSVFVPEDPSLDPRIHALQNTYSEACGVKNMHRVRCANTWSEEEKCEIHMLWRSSMCEGSDKGCQQTLVAEGTLKEIGISSIERHGYANVWDIETARHHTFLANGIAVHNCQELRRAESLKTIAAAHIAASSRTRIGLSATPIYNYGGEFFNVMNSIAPDSLGTRQEFLREWCTGVYGDKPSIRDPKAFGSYLRETGLMIRRTRNEVGRELAPLTKIPHTVEADTSELSKIEDSAAELAQIILAQGEAKKGMKMMAAEQLSNVLRQATGLAKAPYVADFVRMLVESGESVLLYGWHHEVYGIWQAKLEDLKPAWYTGKQSTKQKAESYRRFVEGETKILMMSLRAGAGLDGLQYCCRTVVFGELDWSPGVHDQCMGRSHRDGQPDPVMAYYLLSDYGSDPIVADVLGMKRSQMQGIRDPNASLIERSNASGYDSKKLAKAFMKQRGLLIQEPDMGKVIQFTPVEVDDGTEEDT